MIVLLYDLSGAAHRFFHTTGDSEDQNAVSNEIIKQARHIASMWPDSDSRFVVCCDSRRNWRKELSAEYKAQRESRPDWLYQQIDRAKRMLGADGHVVLECDTMEADDVIASCITSLSGNIEIEKVVVVTIDKDLEQLIQESPGATRVEVYNPVVDNIVSREHVIAKFGVAPEQLGDWLALVGDNSDNVSGAPGIGPKKATELLTRFGSLAGIFGAIELCSSPEQWASLFRKGEPAARVIGGPAVYRSLKESGAQVGLARRLVSLRDDVPIDVERILREPMPTGLKTEEQAPIPDPEFLVDHDEETEGPDDELPSEHTDVVAHEPAKVCASAVRQEPIKTLKTEPEPKPEPQTQKTGVRTMGFTFTKATKKQAKLRLALVGPAGSGKTKSSLKIAQGLNAGRIGLIDSERGSASKYSDEFDFDQLCLDSFSPENYIEAIKAAEQAGFGVLIIDSLSHAWSGKDGALEQVDLATMRSRSKNQFTDGWRAVTPMHNRLVDAMLSCNMHLIATMRTKTEYVIEKDDRGRTVPRKVGLQPVQRSGLEYEFDVVADLDQDNNCIIDKTRCSDLKGKVFNCPGNDMAQILADWLGSGAPAAPREPQQVMRETVARSAVSELEAAMVWTDNAGKVAWVEAVRTAVNNGSITKVQASELSAKSQARSHQLGLTTASNGASAQHGA